MYVEGLYKVAQDAWDTLNKIVPVTDMLLCVQHLSVEQDFAKEDFDYALNQFEDTYNRVFDNTTNKCTIAGTSLKDSFVLHLEERTLEGDDGYHEVYLSCGDTNLLTMRKRWYYDDEFVYHEEYSKVIDTAMKSVNGVTMKVKDLLSTLDESIDFQNFLAHAAEMAQNGSISIQQILTGMGSNSLGDLTQTVRNIITDVSSNFDLSDKIPAGTWLSIFSGIYQRLASAHEDQSGNIEFNDQNYEPKIAWRTIISASVQVLSTIITVVAGPIIRVAAFLVSGAFSIANTIAQAEVTTKVDADSSDILFAQPIGQRAALEGVVNMPFTTYCRNERLVTSFTPYWARMTWSNDGVNVNQEVYARCLPLPVLITLFDDHHLSLMDLTDRSYPATASYYDTLSPSVISDLHLDYVADLYNESFDGVDTVLWYATASEEDKRRAAMLSILLAFFLANYESNTGRHQQTLSIDASYDFSRNIYAMMAYVNHGCNWDDFYRSIYNPWIKPNLARCCYDFPVTPSSSVVCMDDISSDRGSTTVAQGVALDRKHPFITPPDLSLASIIYGTIITAVITAAALATAAVVKKAVIRHNQSVARLRRKQLEDAKAEADEWAQLAAQENLPKQEKAQYLAEWKRLDKKYSKQVRRFNLWAGFHGMAKVDAVTTYDLCTDSSAAASSAGSSMSSLIRDTYSQALEAESVSVDNLKVIKDKLQISSQ